MRWGWKTSQKFPWKKIQHKWLEYGQLDWDKAVPTTLAEKMQKNQTNNFFDLFFKNSALPYFVEYLVKNQIPINQVSKINEKEALNVFE